jgi:hypothetical protein
MKTLDGPEAREALYALAAVTGEVVFALGGDRSDIMQHAKAGASRAGRSPATVVVVKDPQAFLAGLGRVSWKRIPAQLFVDGCDVDRGTLTAIGHGLESVAPVVVATVVRRLEGAAPGTSSGVEPASGTTWPRGEPVREGSGAHAGASTKGALRGSVTESE